MKTQEREKLLKTAQELTEFAENAVRRSDEGQRSDLDLHLENLGRIAGKHDRN